MVAQNCPSLTVPVPTNSHQPQGPIRPDRFKRACDLTLGLGLLIVTLPLIFAIWAFVRATSSGPGFYSQVRVGRGGRTYRIYKIRTMTHNCEAGSGAKWATKGDSRVTPVGRVLRKLHLDEMPQLWNVIRGDMSLVGPRPERPEFVVPLSAEVEGYLERLCVRPGSNFRLIPMSSRCERSSSSTDITSRMRTSGSTSASCWGRSRTCSDSLT
jgi:lipopolysaccharide/colanic/teichoic acid biosynthesis glycosyltransferase